MSSPDYWPKSAENQLLADELSEVPTGRYWHGGDIPSEVFGENEEIDTGLADALLDWVDQNVREAIYDYWCEEQLPGHWIEEVEEAGLALYIHGPEKPTPDDPHGWSENYAFRLPLRDAFDGYMGDGDLEAIERVRQFAKDLLKLADEHADGL